MAERLTDRDEEHEAGSKAFALGKKVDLARLAQEIDEAAGTNIPLVAEGDPNEADLVIWSMVDVDDQIVLDAIEAHTTDVEAEEAEPESLDVSTAEDLLADLAAKDDLTDDEVRLAVQTLLIPYRRH